MLFYLRAHGTPELQGYSLTGYQIYSIIYIS